MQGLLEKSVVLGLVVLMMTATPLNAADTYTVGVVPQFDARRIVQIWQPILDAVSKKSGIQLELKLSTSIPAFEQQFSNGEFDFAYMNPYHALIANRKQGYLPLVRDNGRSLYGIIVVKQDSPIQSITELNGKTVAFPSPNALGAALLPRAEFARKFNISVKELYVKSHSSVYLNVLLGKAVAGGGVQKTLSQQPKKIRDRLRILYKTAKVSPHPLAAHRRVTKSIRDNVQTAFIELGNSKQGRNLLKKIPMKKIGVASMQDYKALRRMGLDKYYVSN